MSPRDPVPGRVAVAARLLVDLVDAGNALADASESDELADAWARANAAVARELHYEP
jgi:hypothetical protein